MKHTHSITTIVTRFVRITAGVTLLCLPFVAMAQVYGGGGLPAGVSSASGLGGISVVTSINDIVVRIIYFILDIALILAVAAVIIAGIYLITSNGDEGQRDKAKKIIYYAVIGIVVILLSRMIVAFVNNIFS